MNLSAYMQEREIEAQIAREQEMFERGRMRAEARIQKALDRGEGADTPAGIALARRAIEPVAQALREYCEAAKSGRAGRRQTAAVLLEKVDPELAAYVAVRCAISAAARQYTLKSTALSLANRLELEVLAEEFEKQNEALYRAIVRNAQSRGMAPSRIAKAVELSARKFGMEPKRWTSTEKMYLGTKLIELVIEKLGIIEAPLIRAGRQSYHRLQFTPKIEEWFQEYNHAASLTRPLFLPSVVEPKPWTSVYGGAYFSPVLEGRSILSRGFPGQLESLEKADLSIVYKGLNGLQNTRWRINRRVFSVMKEAWERGIELPCLPSREDEPVPTPPPEVQNDVRGGPLRRAWRKKVRVIHERNARNRSVRFEFVRALAIAEDCLEYPAIYFPHRLDFRGRAYAASTSLNPQGADEMRALLEFADGKPLGKRGLFWLGVHGANLWGYDKVSLEERFQWAKDHWWHTVEVVKDPLGYLWWTEADKPWSFLAWCFEWSYAAGCSSAHAEQYISHLPIALDGSCNGIQHFSAMLRDPIGGAAVNLVPSDKPQDIYQRVADRVTERLKHHVELKDENTWIAQGWLQFGIDRKITKRAVMVLPYGGTFKSCMDYVRDAVREKIDAGQENPFGDELRRAETFLASLVWNSIGDVVVAAREVMSWLQDVARVATAAGVPLKWTTPSGFVVHQAYREKKDQRIETRFCGSIVRFRSIDEDEKLDRTKQCSAVAPNFVHSMDASALMLTICAGLDEGITHYAMIHDSYGTHAADTDKLATILRREFVRMYQENDVLAKFRDEIAAQLPPEAVKELPPLPTPGTLDLNEVLRSDYFFA